MPVPSLTQHSLTPSRFKDINRNHVGLDLNSMVSTHVSDLGSVDINLKSSDLVSSWIEYDGSSRVINVSVSYSNRKPKDPFLSSSLDLGMYVSKFRIRWVFQVESGSTEIHSIE
ncbi:hypothetical protein ACFX13_044574 [Malus domestica]